MSAKLPVPKDEPDERIVLPFSPEALFQALSNELIPAEQVATRQHPKYLARYLNDIKAATIVVERDYTDGDYLDDYAEYYVKCWWPYRRRCKRVHFFKTSFTEEELLRIVSGRDSVERITEDEGYLGFVVARPLPEAIVGRTVLRPYPGPKDGGRRNYPVIRGYSANLFGLPLELKSLAYQEQDAVTAACATVALWSAFHRTSSLFGTPEPTPKQITTTAGQVIQAVRTFPSKGLTFEQMNHAIRSVGLESEKVEVTGATPLASLIYGHISYGVPVILLVDVDPPGPNPGFHAVTVTGYSVRDEPVLEKEIALSEEDALRSYAQRIDEFYVHDDQVGPFARVRVKGPEEVEREGQIVSFPVVFEGEVEPGGPTYTMWPLGITVPLYHKVRVTFIDAHKQAYKLDQFLRRLYPHKVEWDIRLTTTNGLKRTLKEEGRLQTARLEQLLLLPHPRFIWRVGVSIGGEDALELFMDGTDMARSFPVYEAVWYDDDVKSAVERLVSQGEQVEETLSFRFAEFLRNSL